jgi:peroxiredoxin
MRRPLHLLALAAACAAPRAESAPADAAGETAAPIALGDSLPRLAYRTLAGDSVRLGGRGGPPTLVNVWATWCTSCREEMADLEALHRELAPRGLRVVAVSIDGGDGERVRRFVARERLTFAVAHDAGARVQRAYGVVGVPETYVVGGDGRLLWHKVGGIHGGTAEARAAAVKALGDASGTAPRTTVH